MVVVVLMVDFKDLWDVFDDELMFELLILVVLLFNLICLLLVFDLEYVYNVFWWYLFFFVIYMLNLMYLSLVFWLELLFIFNVKLVIMVIV